MTARRVASRRRARRLSRARVKALVCFHQFWLSDKDGQVWQVTRIRRADGTVRLERAGAAREVTFSELGRQYTLVDEDSEG